MECREVRQIAEAFVSEQVLVETTQAVVAHLERCPACRDEIAGLRRLRAAMRSAFARAPELASRPTLAAELAPRVRSSTGRAPAAPRPARPWLAMAAATLLVVGAGWGWRAWSASSVLALVRAAIGDHRYCALTFKLAEPPISLDEAARRYGGDYDRLQAVEPDSTSLEGDSLQVLARHSCVFEGRRFAHIVLRYKHQPVSVLVTDDTRPGLARIATSAGVSVLPAAEGFHIASFGGARRAVFVVSSLDDDDVRAVARALERPVSRALAGA